MLRSSIGFALSRAHLMTTKRTAILVVVLGALAAWLAAAATSGVGQVKPVSSAPARIDLHGAALAAEIERLHDRLRPTASPEHSRNLFQFASARVQLAPALEQSAPAAAVEAPAPAAAPPEPALKLIGVAETPGTRTAILTSSSQLLMATVGDIVATRYRVTVISPDAVELVELADGHVLRLALK
jgi:hypothetical protein